MRDHSSAKYNKTKVTRYRSKSAFRAASWRTVATAKAQDFRAKLKRYEAG